MKDAELALLDAAGTLFKQMKKTILLRERITAEDADRLTGYDKILGAIDAIRFEMGRERQKL